MPAEEQDLASGGYLPDPHVLISPGRSQVLTIRAECHTVDVGLMFRQGVEQGVLSSFALRIEIPDLGRAIPAGGGQTPPVGTEGYPADMVLVGREPKALLARGRIPYGDFAVLATRGDPAAIGAERDTEHGGIM